MEKNPTRMIFLFVGQDGEKNVRCAITMEALEDHFPAGKNPLKVFQANQDKIEHLARRKYLAGKLEPDSSVLIKTDDI